MAAVIENAPVSSKMIWAGRIFSAVPVLMMVMSGIMKLVLVFSGDPEMAKGFTDIGWDPKYALTLAILELGSAIVYIIPRTAVLGAILVTGYLGGAIATHVRIGDPWFGVALVLGILFWAGIYLREPRLMSLIPVRSR